MEGQVNAGVGSVVAVRAKMREAGRLTEAGLLAKYPHMVVGSLRWNDLAQKQQVEITCGCGSTREVFTSDLFQIDTCKPCTKIERKSRRKANKAAAKASKAQTATATIETVTPETAETVTPEIPAEVELSDGVTA
jgi:hypothetical protein